MDRSGQETRERQALEGEIIPPGAPERGFGRGAPGSIFFDLRGEDGTIRIKPVSRWKLALWITIVAAIALALVLTFASLFVIVAIVTACAAALAVASNWVRGLFRPRP